MAEPVPTEISFQEYLACTQISQEWASSYDTKDWHKLASIVAPEMHIDYRSVMGPEYLFPSMPATNYISMMKDPKKLGNPLVTTQHFLGTPSFGRTSGAEIIGTYQLRAHHLRFDVDGQGDDVKRRGSKVLSSATGHAIIKHFYRKTEGKEEWKLAGLQPRVLYDEGDLKTLFEM